MFPRPTSSRILVRKTLAATIEELGHIFAAEVETFLAEEARARSGHFEKVEFLGDAAGEDVSLKEKRVRKLSQKVLTVAVGPDEFPGVSETRPDSLSAVDSLAGPCSVAEDGKV